jgi:glycosyltransferase involved in cell wall biosynthesis
VGCHAVLGSVRPHAVPCSKTPKGTMLGNKQPKQFCPTRVAVIGNYLPRQCGIATFTTDLCDALAADNTPAGLFALAVNDGDAEYRYPERVRFELQENDLATYRAAAEFLNFHNVDLVCLQHEYGIFGGQAGAHILWLLRCLKMPIVTTLHTVLREPNPQQRKVMEELAELSDRMIVMSEHSSQFLQDIYRVPVAKIDLIPHGVPDLPFVDPNFYKANVGAEGKDVILTFGLLSQNKGIENVIRALPRILERHNDVLYVVAGATHPHVRRREGDRYRESLQSLAQELRVDANVVFHNRFVTPAEMVEFLGSADLYITPYRAEAQVVSGTLAYAMSAGKAIIATPYWYARELLAEGRGALVPFDDPDAIAQQAIELLDDDAARHAMRKRAYLHVREMTWKNVARKYRDSFVQAHADRTRAPRPAPSTQLGGLVFDRLPVVKPDHLLRMTDGTGLLQHALFTVPNLAEGYTTDDNARGLIVAVLLEQLGTLQAPDAINLAAKYLAFLNLAFSRKTGRFRNCLSHERRWLDHGSEDCHGRALWALGTVLGRSGDLGLRGAAGHLFGLALPVLPAFSSPRAWAFALLGIQEYLASFPGDRDALHISQELTQRLLQRYSDARSGEWKWFEDSVAYGNARLPQALLSVSPSGAGGGLAESAALESLEWLANVQRSGSHGYFVPIGSEGFYPKGGARARFDQQPIEAAAMVSACLQALRVTGDPRWRKEAWSAFNWFLGQNDLQLPLYDSLTGGCRDGLHPDRVNENQGAESTLSFLMALLELRLLERSELRHARFAEDEIPAITAEQHGVCEVVR